MPLVKTRLTDATVQALPYGAGQQEYQDTKNQWLRLLVGSNTKAWIVRASYGGKRAYTTIGQFPLLSCKEAADRAMDFARHFAEHGTWPSDLSGESTLRHALTLHLAELEHLGRRPGTVKLCRRMIELWFTDWLDVPLASIKRPMLLARHQGIKTHKGLPRGVGKRLQVVKEGDSPATADMAVTQFRAVYLTAAMQWPHAGLNPMVVRKLEQGKKGSPKQISADDAVYRNLWDFISGYRNRLISLAWQVKLYTGLRVPSLTQLEWSDIDFQSSRIHVRHNKRNTPFYLPMSRQIAAMFEQIPQTASPYVFPSTASPRGHLGDLEHDKLPVTPHDFRRLWATAAERAGVSEYDRNILGHWTTENETAAGYVQDRWKSVMASQQVISDYLDRVTGRKDPA